jgi:plastocyanin
MTIRTKAYLLGTSYVAGQPTGSIGSDDHRDFVESADSWVGPAPVTLTSGTTVTWATAGEKRNYATLTLAHNATLDITGEVAGAQGLLEVTQDGTGSRTFTLPAGTVVGATTSINATASKLTLIAWSYNGTSFRFVLSQEA